MPKRKIFEKIIAGGQTGSDQGALEAAIELGHPCGGWCPKGRKSEAGPILEKYSLQEHSSSMWPVPGKARFLGHRSL
ncbi:MAG: YpsA SLOG family protein [Thermodesulfobacteriota bacterium]